jgi:hypothetical protein
MKANKTVILYCLRSEMSFYEYCTNIEGLDIELFRDQSTTYFNYYWDRYEKYLEENDLEFKL